MTIRVSLVNRFRICSRSLPPRYLPLPLSWIVTPGCGVLGEPTAMFTLASLGPAVCGLKLIAIGKGFPA